ncbi:hypothetical protein BTO30_14385 [Domibacillus antri]|uniref:Uncharacterized protein n=1 Tax=Domibacillus antri TaxID=1714264 RepID=A0A1Q8Q2H9_9BACI|nr:hypothetical protein [Domibacillus antri]OLN21515.1 hypothetical protein BTO30_14385 [Domibacillus antri]
MAYKSDNHDEKRSKSWFNRNDGLNLWINPDSRWNNECDDNGSSRFDDDNSKKRHERDDHAKNKRDDNRKKRPHQWIW